MIEKLIFKLISFMFLTDLEAAFECMIKADFKSIVYFIVKMLILTMVNNHHKKCLNVIV